MTISKVKRLVSNMALRVVELADLQVDHSYQREVKAKHKRIVAEFNEKALGLPLVGQRDDGSLWVVDGVQRKAALEKLGWTKVRCEVFASNGPEHEAEIFKLVNLNRAKLDPREEFRALLRSKDPTALAVNNVVEECGYKITLAKAGTDRDPARASRELTCVTTLRRHAKDENHGLDAIKFALVAVGKAWPGDRYNTNADLIDGICLFYKRLEGLADMERLVPRLMLSTPQKVMAAAAQRAVTSGSRGNYVSQIIEELYNRRSGKKT